MKKRNLILLLVFFTVGAITITEVTATNTCEPTTSYTYDNLGRMTTIKQGTADPLCICNTCHSSTIISSFTCDNKPWKMHTRKYYIDLQTQQLAEKTYLGKICGSSTPVAVKAAATKTRK